MREGLVYYNNIFAGTLRELEDGFSFQYDLNYLNDSNTKPISLTLPLQQKAFTSKQLFPFFDGLIPEGWLLTIAISHWKIKQNDRFGLLLTLCEDTIGCVSVIAKAKNV
jgi:serine/threonine-protein kinase HipA